jgi:hypothetical protein
MSSKEYEQLVEELLSLTIEDMKQAVQEVKEKI